jgi:iron complex transport system substrate-binding protein
MPPIRTGRWCFGPAAIALLALSAFSVVAAASGSAIARRQAESSGGAAGARATPARIVSTSPSITETLFALGLGSRVVGVSQFCRYPAEVERLPRVGPFLTPDAERIAALRPDLVLLHSVSNGIDRRLGALKIPFAVVQRGTMASVLSSIRTVGEAAGVRDRAEALVGDLTRRLDRLRRSTPPGPRPTVLFIIGRRAGMLADLVSVGRDAYLHELIEAAGGRNVLDVGFAPYPRISMETVLRLDPDVIIDTVDMGESVAERRERAVANARLWRAFPTLKAVAAGRLHAATTDAVVVPGPRVVDAAEWIASLVRGEAVR